MKTLRTLLILFIALTLSSYNGQSKSSIMKTKMQDSLMIAAILEQDEDFLNQNLSRENVNKRYNVPVGTMRSWGDFGEMNHPIGGEGTLLHLAAYYGLPNSAKILIEKGAEVNAKNSEGLTPLQTAVSIYLSGTEDVQKVLIENKADMNFYVNMQPQVPLLFQYIWWNAYDLAKLAIENGADVNMRTSDGGSILEFAERRGTPEIVRMLRAKGATK